MEKLKKIVIKTDSCAWETIRQKDTWNNIKDKIISLSTIKFKI
jgi:hypothetical protein